MRFSALTTFFTIATLVYTGAANAHPDLDNAEFAARELGLGTADAFAELSAREILSEISTRELIDELNDRLERRDQAYSCRHCGKRCANAAQLRLHRKQAHGL